MDLSLIIPNNAWKGDESVALRAFLASPAGRSLIVQLLKKKKISVSSSENVKSEANYSYEYGYLKGYEECVQDILNLARPPALGEIEIRK